MAETYAVERKIQVDAPASAVYERIVDFRRWPAWSPFEELDPGMDRACAGPERTTTFALDDSGDGTAVTWSITGPVTLMKRMMGIFRSINRMIGPTFEKGLARLKADAEAARPSPTGTGSGRSSPVIHPAPGA